jgi:CIC family chloride channel protein
VMLQPAMGGVVIGTTLLFVPEIKGVGYDYVDQALNGGLVMQTMIVLCVVKLVATVVSYCSGNAGGIFAPSLFIGAMTGGVVGMIVNSVAPFPTGEPGAYALVGMGALFAGIIRAPLTSVFMIFEITQDYQILVPLMVANLLSFAISRRYQPVPVYEALLHQDQIHLPSGAFRESAGWTARDIMKSDALSFLAPGQSVDEAWEATGPDRRLAYLVGTRASIRGIVTPERLSALRTAGRGSEAVQSTLNETFVHVHPDHSLDVVLLRFAQGAGLLPVVSRTALRVDGVITIDEITQFARQGKSR